MGIPFKMKGSPMQRNFGIGSPLHQEKKKIKHVKGLSIFGKKPKEIVEKWYRQRIELPAKIMVKALDPVARAIDWIAGRKDSKKKKKRKEQGKTLEL